ncbi:MAG TPA: T9SS type A sorting domain-containing protein [Edaphocola sp.]|nr:T9SS type A sorting domain-containing protein [Edaphocola sp.]
MKNLILFVVVLLSFQSLMAQTEFAPLGAKWSYRGWYSSPQWNHQEENLIKFECIDTFQRDGKTIKVVEQIKERQFMVYNYYTQQNNYTSRDTISRVDSFYEQNYTVFVYNQIFSKYTPLYIFNAQEGDTITLPIMDTLLYNNFANDSIFSFVIDSIRMVDYDGVLLETFNTGFNFATLDTSWTSYNTTTQPFLNWSTRLEYILHNGFLITTYPGAYARTLRGIGSGLLPVRRFIPKPFVAEEEHDIINVINCYTDSNINIHLSTKSCDTLPDYTKYTSIADVISKNNLNLYPNPAKDKLLIATDNGIHPQAQLYIFDSFGKLVYSQKVSNNSQNIEIDIQNLPSGIYFIRMALRGGVLGSSKFVKA